MKKDIFETFSWVIKKLSNQNCSVLNWRKFVSLTAFSSPGFLTEKLQSDYSYFNDFALKLYAVYSPPIILKPKLDKRILKMCLSKVDYSRIPCHSCHDLGEGSVVCVCVNFKILQPCISMDFSYCLQRISKVVLLTPLTYHFSLEICLIKMNLYIWSIKNNLLGELNLPLDQKWHHW